MAACSRIHFWRKVGLNASRVLRALATATVLAGCGESVEPAVPRLVLTPSALTFAATQNGANPIGQTATISNNSNGLLSNLSVGNIQYGPGPIGWLQTPVLSGTTANPTAFVGIQPLTGNLAPGTYTATIPVLSSVASNSPQNVSITFTVSPAP